MVIGAGRREAGARAGAHGGTDLGRRIREHRHRAGLSREEVARRAGVAGTYLAYVETNPDASPPAATLTRLAAALGTTSRALSGAGLDLPPGRQPPEAHPVAEELTPAECRSRLGEGGVGRLVYIEARGPVALPFNYRMLGDDIVVRTSASAGLLAATAQERVSFEVDHLDEALGEGWSVLVTGRTRLVAGTAELVAVESLNIAPWPGGTGHTYLRITPGEVTGRRIRAT